MNHHILILWGPSGEGELRSGRWGEKSRKNAGIVRRWDSPVGKLKTYVVKCGIFFGDEYLSIISIIWFWQFLKDRLNSQFAIENGHRHSGFTHEKICTKNRKLYWLLLWNIWIIFFHLVGNFIIPTDELIFFRGVGIPPTSDQIWDMLGCSTVVICLK